MQKILLIICCLLFSSCRHWAVSTVAFSDFERVENQPVFVSPTMTPYEREKLLYTISQAKQRVAGLFGAYTATPVVIASYDRDIRTYLKNTYGSTYYFPHSSYVVVGANGLNMDVLAHELTHAELTHRLGYWRRVTQVPLWFDEGVAMQVDNRLDTSRDFRSAPPEKKSFRDFETNPSRDRYVLVKQELHRWLQPQPANRLNVFIQNMNKGMGFESAYAVRREFKTPSR